MNGVNISQVRSKLESGIFPMDLPSEERAAWNEYKSSENRWAVADESRVSEENLEKLYQWLNAPEED